MMFNFKDPNEFETVPPVPDIKAWLNEFRHKHPCMLLKYIVIFSVFVRKCPSSDDKKHSKCK